MNNHFVRNVTMDALFWSIERGDEPEYVCVVSECTQRNFYRGNRPAKKAKVRGTIYVVGDFDYDGDDIYGALYILLRERQHSSYQAMMLDLTLSSKLGTVRSLLGRGDAGPVADFVESVGEERAITAIDFGWTMDAATLNNDDYSDSEDSDESAGVRTEHEIVNVAPEAPPRMIDPIPRGRINAMSSAE